MTNHDNENDNEGETTANQFNKETLWDKLTLSYGNIRSTQPQHKKKQFNEGCDFLKTFYGESIFVKEGMSEIVKFPNKIFEH